MLVPSNFFSACCAAKRQEMTRPWWSSHDASVAVNRGQKKSADILLYVRDDNAGGVDIKVLCEVDPYDPDFRGRRMAPRRTYEWEQPDPDDERRPSKGLQGTTWAKFEDSLRMTPCAQVADGTQFPLTRRRFRQARATNVCCARATNSLCMSHGLWFSCVGSRGGTRLRHFCEAACS